MVKKVKVTVTVEKVKKRKKVKNDFCSRGNTKEGTRKVKIEA